jgi:hypothetical protein
MQFWVATNDWGNTYLKVYVVGWLQSPAYRHFQYRYLLILSGNTLFGDYITVQIIYFSWQIDNVPDQDFSIVSVPTNTNGSV